jgi:Ca-activated chloride channel family protein
MLRSPYAPSSLAYAAFLATGVAWFAGCETRTASTDGQAPKASRIDGAQRSAATSSPSPMFESADAAVDYAFDAAPLEAIEIPLELSSVPEPNSELYEGLKENDFVVASAEPLSTFSIDVDTASYSNIRRFVSQGQLPPADAVRIEEMVNYFRYDYPRPEGDVPFAVDVEVSACPWKPEHRLARIGLAGREIDRESRPPSNLVFLVDVSGSMSDFNKLPLVKTALRMLVEQLDARDRIAIVVYAGDSRVALPPTPADRREEILTTVESLQSGGSTHGSAGIREAYRLASQNFVTGGVNRVILCTDGDFNVGTTNQEELTELIQQQAKTGVFLSVLGFGMGNYKDATLEKLADEGNGSYAYLDNTSEARKTFVEQMTGTLITIAKDVKIQVDFNPGKVAAYRLVGYENRMLANEDFKNDAKDAGDIGAGHTVTALYEIVPAGQPLPDADVEPSKYVRTDAPAQEAALVESDELLTVRLRYKLPDSDKSEPLILAVIDDGKDLNEASSDFRFAAAVAALGMRLQRSQRQGENDFDLILDLAQPGLEHDPLGYRQEFVTMTEEIRKLEDR